MKLLGSYRVLAFALILLSIVGLCVAQNSVSLLLVAGALAAMSWYVTEGPRGRSLPTWVSNILVIGVCLNVIVDLWQHPMDFLGVLGRFSVWLTLIKLYERRSARDFAHLLALSLLLMLTGALQSSSLLFGVILLIYSALGLYVLVLYQLFASFEDAKIRRNHVTLAQRPLVPAIKPIIGRRVGLQFRALITAISIVGLLFGAAVFMVFPRGVGDGALTALAVPKLGESRLGMSNEVNLLTSGRITESRAKAMEVTLFDESGEPMRVDGALRLRSGIVHRYDGEGKWRGQLKPKETESVDTSLSTGQWLVQEPHPSSFMHARIELQRSTSTLFTPGQPVWVSTSDVGQLEYDRRTQLLTDRTSGRVLSYEVRTAEQLSNDHWETLVRKGVGRPSGIGFKIDAVRLEARRLLNDAGVSHDSRQSGLDYWEWSRRVADVMLRYLRSDAFEYTLDLSSAGYNAQEDPIEQFLKIRRGHCEYFASAFVALCQSVSVRSRMVLGYTVYDYNAGAERYDVLDANAHAWAEVATDKHRWTIYDPTPAAVLSNLDAADATVADRMRWIYQKAEGSWSARLMGYNSRSQQNLAASIDSGWSDRLKNFFDSIRNTLASINRAFYLGPAGYIWMGIVALALVIAVIALGKLMRRSRRIREVLQLQYVGPTESARLLRQLGFYLDMLTTLERGGIAKPAWAPPAHYAEQLQATHPEASGIVGDLTALFYRSRYAHQRLSSEELRRARTLVESLDDLLTQTSHQPA